MRLGDKERVIKSIISNFTALSKHIEKREYKGYEFDDLLGSKLLNALSFNNLLIQRIFVQIGKFLPINIRPILGVQMLPSTKANGFFAKGYLYMFKVTQDELWLHKAVNLLDWLLTNYSLGYSGLAWGNSFDFASRGGFFKKGLPTVVWTSHINNTFYIAYKETGLTKYRNAVVSSANFIINDLERHEDENGICIAYAPGRLNLIHNSNLLGAIALLRAWELDRDNGKFEIARKMFSWSISQMNKDGSWYYGVSKKYKWIDNFHTAYVLDCLVEGYNITNGIIFDWDVVDKTFKFWRDNFFLEDGTPKYYHDRKYPLDIQCAAQAIESFAKYSVVDKEALMYAIKVYRWTVRNMKKNGAFIFQKWRFFTNKLESIHWGQSTMLSAMGVLLYYIKKLQG